MGVSADGFQESLGDLERLADHLPFETKDPALVILKGHLLLEELLREFIDLKLAQPQYLEDWRLGFAQSVALARALCEWGPLEWVWQAALKVNALRNSLAHNLEPRNIDTRIAEFISFVGASAPTRPESGAEEWKSLHSALIRVYIRLSMGLRFTPKGLLG